MAAFVRFTYQGPLYKGGYSDHFPVTLDFEWRFPE